MSWKKRVGLGAALISIGMVTTLYGVSHWEAGQRWLGLSPDAADDVTVEAVATAERRPLAALQVPGAADDPAPSVPTPVASDSDTDARIAALERAMVRAEGAAGRADGLLIAFAARRAAERGLPLGVLEPLLVDRFAARHEAAVGTLIANARDPVLLDDLVEVYQGLGDELRGPGPDASMLDRVRRTLGSLVMVYPASEANPRPRARFERALVDLKLGNVEGALAETMRLPGARGETAQRWVGDARRYIATQRALDTIETAALLNRENIATN
ncbi:hypothetical protein [Sphingomicrobium arenosum]|uniref:hypothetical protein n=1 Tax=Sphingomicrobium arenosum TaxID=2233861 RepID=UPI002240FF28|nr:hypothetical protein [Sphingomicrobium arenosum]